MNTPEILYEDNHVIVAIKPHNLPVQADSSCDTDMLTLLKAYIKEKYHKEGNVFLGLVHRLDRPVGGVMVFARTSKAAERLSKAFAQHQVHKSYMAVVCGRPDKRRAHLECHMKKDETTFSSHICSSDASGAKYASLNYTCAAYSDGLSLLDIRLNTGRHHQIRLQLSAEGLPIYGDHRYNPSFINVPDVNIALFAYSLEFPHPVTHNPMRFCAAPKDAVWNRFRIQIKMLLSEVVPVYTDENIIVCDKARGVSVAIADGDTHTLEERLTSTFTYARPVHRLDATTEGLVVFAANPESYNALIDAFSHHGEYLHKFYICRVFGRLEGSATLTAYMTKDEKRGIVHITKNDSAGAKKIITKYRTLSTAKEAGEATSILEIELITGRTHQIRAHMAFIGHPLVGDDRYGDRELNKKLRERVPALRSERIVFDFPAGHFLEYLNEISIGNIGDRI